MSKYRIIKILSRPQAPYQIQEWSTEMLTWESLTYLTHETLKDAKKTVQGMKKYEAEQSLPSEVVWEDDDE